MLILATLFICGLTVFLVIRSFNSERRIPTAGAPSIEVSTLVELPGKRAYPEALTLGPDGFIYSGSFCTGEIWRVNPEDGTLETWLAEGSGIGAVSGLAFAPDGILYVADRNACDPRLGLSSLKRVLPDKTVETWGVVTEDEIINNLAFGPEGILYASDTQLRQIRAYDAEGRASIWWELPPDENEALPTGLAYDAARNALIVADSNNGMLYRVPFNADGTAGQPESLYRRDDKSLDGLTLDDEGRVIFTSYSEGAVLRLESNGMTTLLGRNFRDPSDVAYLEGRVYVTNFDGVSLAPFISLLVDPSLPFTLDVIDLRG
jgi:sugar lactone lactonase YvrE